ncbi:MAG: hypothetical protein U1F20_10755 [Lysobacterales bacterium]
MRPSILVVLMPLALAACTSNPARSRLPFFPQVAPTPPGGYDPTWLTAAFEGEVVVENGCVKVRYPGARPSTTVLWYQGIELDRDERGLFLRDESGAHVTRFHTMTQFGGGEAPAKYIEKAYPEIARRCGPPYAYGYPANVYDSP